MHVKVFVTELQIDDQVGIKGVVGIYIYSQ